MSHTPTEQEDARQVDSALQALMGGEVARAESELQQIAKHAPAPEDYVYQFEGGDGALHIKFWDQNEFIHYVTWHRELGTDRSVVWMPSAYPRAFYYLGFVNVKLGRFEQAIEFLGRGKALEPSNPNFPLEMAHIGLRLRLPEKSLEIYDSFRAPGPHLSPTMLALAMRGRGSALIELNRWDEAERAFQESLEWDPRSELARNELRYIEHMRSGGAATEMDPTITLPQDHKCVLCGKVVSDGQIFQIKGRAMMVCQPCVARLEKDAAASE